MIKYKKRFLVERSQILKAILSQKSYPITADVKDKRFCKCTRINGIFCYLSLISGVLIRSFPIFSLLSIVSLPLSFIWEIEGYPIHSENSIIILLNFPVLDHYFKTRTQFCMQKSTCVLINWNYMPKSLQN